MLSYRRLGLAFAVGVLGMVAVLLVALYFRFDTTLVVALLALMVLTAAGMDTGR
jgi:hypothetical protein